MSRRLLILVFFLCLTVPVQAADGDTTSYRSAYELVLDEQWNEAVKAFTAFVGQYPQSSWADDAGFWRCYARERAGMDQRATFDCYLELQKKWPDSEWVDDAQRAAVKLARDLARNGDDSYLDQVRGFQGDEDTESTLAVLAALAEVGDEASVQAILDRLQRTDEPRLRAEMVSILDDVDSDAAMATVVEMAKNDPSPEVRSVAVDVIADRSATEHFELLAEIATTDSNADVREEAVWAIAESEDRRSVQVLESIAQGTDRDAAEAAIEGLGESEHSEAQDALERLLADPSMSDRRIEIAWAIAESDSPRALSLLSGLARSNDTEVAEEAIEAIGDLEHPGGVAFLVEIAGTSSNRRLRVAAVEALSNNESDEGFDAQVRLLKNADDAHVRAAAAEELGWWEDDRAIGPLADAAQTDPDSRVRENATRALGEIGSARARDALIGLLKK